jgi:hypothetical protein
MGRMCRKPTKLKNKTKQNKNKNKTKQNKNKNKTKQIFKIRVFIMFFKIIKNKFL